jgi:sec-independent protein translocase protein TatA
MGIGWRELLIVLFIVVLVFGTKKLKNVGSDLGEAVKGFKKGMADDTPAGDKPQAQVDAERSDEASRADKRD